MTLESIQVVAFEYSQGAQPSQLLELFGVVIDGRGGHFSQESLQYLRQSLGGDHAPGDHDDQRADDW